MRVIDGGITAPLGFLATGRHVGIKKVKKDLALLLSQAPCQAAGCFTQSRVRAAHILWDERIVRSGQPVRALVAISGNANACTGSRGIWDNEEMARCLARELGIPTEEVLTAATGVIGAAMPMDKITRGIRETVGDLSRSRTEAQNAARAILTTDTFQKELALEVMIKGKPVRIGAMAKGSGMIHPNMATVLSFVTTDCAIQPALLQKALSAAVGETYNMISVDGATSTNDMALIFANGLAENEPIEEEDECYDAFAKALLFLHEKFAKDIVHDGEGAGKYMEVDISGAKSEQDARVLAKSVVTNNLVKTALYGEDANWGRIIAAMGGSGAYFVLEGLTMAFQSAAGRVVVMEQGEPVAFDEDEAAAVLRERDIRICISLQDGAARAAAWGCDLTHEYIRINGEYRSRA
ncbi:MAG TPA: bifunctional ornithine acetyltransferase/N-acetylglutamate synthase [Firmicutes bacterium]|nr:bifunctional ornithine acetyltransferase/N-acetylglutamate synthase [Bacillota bacterium]